MICEIAEYGQRESVRVKKQKDRERVWHSSNIMNLCVDTCDREKQSGKLYHLYTKEPIVFSSLFEALNQMDALYDELQFPQASTILRSFSADRREQACAAEEREWKSKGKEVREMEKFDRVIEHRGSCATFLIRVQYRQHSSWQGEVTWVDKQKKEYFRSALELIRLLDSALNTEEKKDAE